MDEMVEFRRAVQREPRSVRYVRSLAETAQFLCLYDEALPMMRRAVELTEHEPTTEALVPQIPFAATGSTKEGEEWLARIPPEQARTPTMIYLGKAWAVQIGDFAGYVALDRQQRYADTFGEAKGIQDTTAAFVFAAMGDKAAARQRAAEAVSDLTSQLEKQPANEILWTNLGLAHAVLGEREESLRCAQKAKDLVPESKDAIFGPGYSLNYATCLAWLGDKDRALAELARLLRTPRGENIYTVKAGVWWFPLRGDPRFEALVNDPKNNAPLL
jgi:tetratricopeptide (TPR) repeat protein